LHNVGGWQTGRAEQPEGCFITSGGEKNWGTSEEEGENEGREVTGRDLDEHHSWKKTKKGRKKGREDLER